MDFYDVIIIGAGPAGLSLTRNLANSDLKILLLDKKKNAEDILYNSAGSFIDPKKLKIPHKVLHDIYSLRFNSMHNHSVKHGHAYVINKRLLLHFLEKESLKNKFLTIEYNIKIKNISLENSKIRSITYLKKNVVKHASAKIFVDCSGNNSVLANKLNLYSSKYIQALGIEYLVPLKKESTVSELFVTSNLKGGYGWIFPLNSKTAIVGYGTLIKENFSNMDKIIRSLWDFKHIQEKCELKVLEKHLAVLKTGPPLNHLVKNNLVLFGDSGLQANPLIGEGIRFILNTSTIIAFWVKKALLENNLKLLKNYEKEWKHKYYAKFKLAFKLQHKFKYSVYNDSFLDDIVDILKKLSDDEFVRLLKADINMGFLLKLYFKYALFLRAI